MSKECLLVAISNQKGGVGKSALTVVLASYLHYEKDLNVAIIDCDSPQHSLVRMRERDKKAISASPYHQQLVESNGNAHKRRHIPLSALRQRKQERRRTNLPRRRTWILYLWICRERCNQRVSSAP